MRIAGILLAAGRSTRFGSADKLAAPLKGSTVMDHSARAIRDLPIELRFIVRTVGAEGMDGFNLVHVESGAPMSRSLAVGIAAARRSGADAALVTLADMPFVTTEHLAALLRAWAGPSSLVASATQGRRSPPALFGSDWFDTLERGTGDSGGRSLLRQARLIEAPAGMLHDIDTVEDLEAAGL